MIGIVDVAIQAHNPNMPLWPLRAYVNSPSSLRLRNVPKKIGQWEITSVQVNVNYPDKTQKTAQCVLVGGVWVGTVEGSSATGSYTNGYTVLANGTDENGNPVSGYVLGRGDVEILKEDGTPIADDPTHFVTDDELDAAISSKAEISDVDDVANDLTDLSNSLSDYYLKTETSSTTELDAKFETKADLSALNVVENSLSNYYIKTETSSAIEIQTALNGKQPTGDYALVSQIPLSVSQLENDSGYLTEHQSLSDYYTKNETSSAVELDAKFETKADLSTLNEVADSLSNYYTKNETSSTTEIQNALDGKQPTGDYALTSQLPTKTSELSNDSGYITSAQVIPSQINAGNASMSDKSLASQVLANDVTDEHSTRVIVDEYDNVILQKYTTGWYVSKIEEGTGSPIVYTETDAYYAFVSDIRIEPSEGMLYYTVACQDKQRNLISKYRQSSTPNYSADEFITDAIHWTTSEAGHSIIIRLTVKNAQTSVWVNVARLVPDSSKFSGLLDTQITPNGQFVTPTQVKPFTAMPGYASRAQGSLFMFGRSAVQTPDENHYVTIDYSAGKLCYVGQSYYPWQLSMYNGTTFDPPLEMVYGYRSTVGYKVNGRVRNIVVNSNCWLAIHTVDSRNTMPYYIKAVEDDDGYMIPDYNLYVATVAHPITFDEFKLSIETIDGVTDGITCTRQGTGTYTTEFKYFPFEDELSVKADVSALNVVENSLSDYALVSQIPLSVSQLENDAGYLTEHQSLSDYYTKSETSSNAEISTALNLKQDTLTSEQLSNIARVPYIDPANTIVTFDDDSVGVYNVVGELTQNIKQEWERLAGAYVKDIKIGTNVNALGNSLFYRAYNNVLTSVTIPDSVTSIGTGAFSGCTSLTKVTIPNSVTNIANSVFHGCSGLTSVTIPNGVTSIEGFAFRSCTSLSSVAIPESTTNIGENTFRQSGITNITIPNNISSIGTDAFNSCTNLTSLTFKGKTLAEVQAMSNYPWGISDTSIIKTWNDASQEWVLEQLSALEARIAALENN